MSFMEWCSPVRSARFLEPCLYYAGRFYKLRRLRKPWANTGAGSLTCSELDRAVDWFNRHGNKAVFVGRLVPAIRTLISVPAGLVRMNLFIFLLYSAIGSLLWTALLTWAGFILQSQYHNVEKYMNPLTNLVFIVIFAVYLYRLITYKTLTRKQRTPVQVDVNSCMGRVAIRTGARGNLPCICSFHAHPSPFSSFRSCQIILMLIKIDKMQKFPVGS